MVLIRPLAITDAPPYRRLMLHAYEHAPDAFTSTAPERAALPDAWWERRIADPQGLGIAFGGFADDGTLAGTVALEFSAKPKTKHKALLIGMFVLEAYRGQGLGQALLQAALAHAERRAGVLVITLTVTEGNEPAIALYRAAGFNAFGTEPMAIHTPTGYQAKVHMWRRVGRPST